MQTVSQTNCWVVVITETFERFEEFDNEIAIRFHHYLLLIQDVLLLSRFHDLSLFHYFQGKALRLISGQSHQLYAAEAAHS